MLVEIAGAFIYAQPSQFDRLRENLKFYRDDIIKTGDLVRHEPCYGFRREFNIRTADDALVLLDRMIADWDAVIAERDREMAEREEECRRYEAECEARIRKEKEAAEAARMEMMRKWRVDESRAFGNKTRSPRGQLAALGIIA